MPFYLRSLNHFYMIYILRWTLRLPRTRPLRHLLTRGIRRLLPFWISCFRWGSEGRQSCYLAYRMAMKFYIFWHMNSILNKII